MGPTEILAEYVSQAKLEDFPNEVILQAKHFIQNEIGCALGGAQTELGQRTIAVARDALGGKPESTIIGDGTRISCAYAAHANTELAVTLDFDDEHKWTLSHPSASIVSSALAVGEMVNTPGRDMLTAVLAAYEVSLRIANAIRSVVTTAAGKQEVHSNPAYTVFGSTAAASKILGLKKEEIVNAFGLAGATPINRGQSPVHLAAKGHPYTDNKYDFGIYALLGVFSTLRARKLAGPKGILDEDRFWKGCGANNYDKSELTRGLGQEFRIMDMTVKPVPFCAVVFAPVTAVWEALKGEKLDPEEIVEIDIYGIPKLEFDYWETMVQAEFSTPCAIAMAITGYEPGPDWYTSCRYKAPKILEMARKVKQFEDPGARQLATEKGQWISSVEVKTKDGKVRKAHIEYEKGVPQNALTEDELHRKFMVNSRGKIGDKQAEELWDAILHLERSEKISDLCSLISRNK